MSQSSTGAMWVGPEYFLTECYTRSDPELDKEALLQSFLQQFWSLWIELSPWLLMGAFAGGLLHIFLPTGWLKVQLGGFRGVLKGVLLGVPLPLCSCGVIPVGLSLRKGGASSGATVGFLISTPQTGVDSILVSATMLSWPFAFFKVFAAAATGILGGWLTDIGRGQPKQELEVLNDEKPTEIGNRWKALFTHAEMLLQSLWRWLVFGVVVSALISQLFSESALADLFVSESALLGKLAAMLVTLLISIPLYVCATASVPIAASLVHSGLPLGAALVFLMAGPATNLATVGAVRKTLGLRALTIYLSVIVLGSVLAGLLFEQLLSDTITGHAGHVHGSSWWMACSQVCGLFLMALVVRFAWQEFGTGILRLARGSRSAGAKPSARKYPVSGMTCHGCVRKLRQILEAHPQIQTAVVSLEPQQIQVSGEASKELVCRLVQEAGFAIEAPESCEA